LQLPVLGTALFGLKDEAAVLIQIDAADGCGSITVLKVDRTLEHILVPPLVGHRGVRPGNTEEVAEFAQEKLVIGPLSGGGVPPPVDEPGRAVGIVF